jgi:norsolorinic acid ketoreductase
LKQTYGITALDVVIANAGIANTYPAVHEASAKAMLEHYTVNVIGVVALFRAVRPLLLRAAATATATNGRTPKFVTMSSSAGSIGGQERAPVPNAAYGPSKAALNWITMKIHLENRDLGLCAFAMHPG